MKPAYETALIMRRAAALQKRYATWGGKSKKGFIVAVRWISLAIDRLHKIGARAEAKKVQADWPFIVRLKS